MGGDAGEVTEVAVRVSFDEDTDFEPPQGSLEVIEVSALDVTGAERFIGIALITGRKHYDDALMLVRRY